MGILAGADEPQIRVLKTHAVVAVPAENVALTHRVGNVANRRPHIDPPGMRKSDPRLGF